MKKLMIAAFAIMAAVAANAASTSWALTAKSIIGVDNVDSSKCPADLAITLYAAEAGSGNWFVVNDMNTAVATTTSGKIAETIFTSSKFTAGEYYDFYFTMTSQNSEGKNVTFTSTTLSGIGAVATGNADLGFGSQDGQTWKSVPEPTSGLLLLLGMAGLALRRKQK